MQPVARQARGWRYAKPILFVASLVPFVWLFALALTNRLGTDPAETITQEMGIWTFRFLLLTLAMTPLRQLTGQSQWIRLRRMLGLFTLFYASVHFLCYATFLATWDWRVVLDDLTQRPYIIVGMSALILLIPLGVTSTNKMQRRLGRNWKRLHRLVYVIGILAMVHFLWIAKSNIGEQLAYMGILAVLLGWRLRGISWRRATRGG